MSIQAGEGVIQGDVIQLRKQVPSDSCPQSRVCSVYEMYQEGREVMEKGIGLPVRGWAGHRSSSPAGAIPGGSRPLAGTRA